MFQRYPGSQYVQRAGEAIGRRALDPTGLGEVIADKVGGPSSGDVGEAIGGALAPQTYGELALELIPGIGFGPDAVRLGRRIVAKAAESGVGIDGVRAWAKSDAGQSVIRALRSETGGGPAEGPISIPDSVKSLVTKRRGPKTPVKTEEELQAAWGALPESTRKLVTEMADVVLSPADRRLIRGAGRARQIASSQQAVESTRGLPADERARAVAGALRGKIMPGIEPVRPRFTQPETDEIFQRLDDAVDNNEILGVEYARAQSAMNLLFYGQRLPGFPGPDTLMPHEIKLLGKVYGPHFEAALPRTKEDLTLLQRSIDLLSIPRSIQAALDFSAPGRQGILLGVKNPDYWFQAWKKQFRGAWSEEEFAKVANEIRSDADFEDAVLHGVDFTDIGGGAGSEEAFSSRLTESWIGKHTIGRSERAYVAFLDYLRLKSYGRGAARLRRTAEKHSWTKDRLDDALGRWAEFVNVASGRGDLGKANNFTPFLNAVFFSPRFFLSRPQSIWQLVRPGQNSEVRRMVFENLGTALALVATGITTLKMTGAADVELDPRSTDFGKIRIGKQRIDLYAGFQPLVRYLAQIGTRVRKDPYARENVPQPAWESIRRFIRSKLSPSGAVGWDFLIEDGRDYEGKEILGDRWEKNLPLYALDRIAPIGLQDIYEGWQEAGPVGAAISSLSLTGASVQSYSPTERQSAIQQFEEAGINVTYVDDKAQIRVPALEKDWESAKWHRLFRDDFRELGDTTDYGYMHELREAYIDYWWDKKGDAAGLGEAATRRNLGDAFEKHDSIKLWRENEKLEKFKVWERKPELLLLAIQSGLEPTSDEKEELLREAGLID